MINGLPTCAGHQVPDLPLIRAHEDPLPFNAGKDNLKVAARRRDSSLD